MSYKTLCGSILLVGVFSGTAFAGGEHAHGHMMEKKATSHEKKNDHSMNNMGGMVHNDEHDSEGSSVGMPAAADQATSIIRVYMRDSMRYEFVPKPNIKKGDIVKFVVINKGNIPHEFSIGDEKEQASHRKMMQKMPGMMHEDGNTVSVFPGKRKELTWKFGGDSEVVFACNVPGHFEAGMYHKVSIMK